MRLLQHCGLKDQLRRICPTIAARQAMCMLPVTSCRKHLRGTLTRWALLTMRRTMTDDGTTPPLWWLYVLDCDGRLYTGVTTDPDRRLREHRAGRSRAARFTRGATSVELRYAVAVGGRSLALQVEYRLKRLSRSEKLTLCEQSPSSAHLLERLSLAP